jgi:activator of 2-hydroxyglutaryl-CoA dehydratase
LKSSIGRQVNVSDEPDMVAALGAALLAYQRLQKLGGIKKNEHDPDLNVG